MPLTTAPALRIIGPVVAASIAVLLSATSPQPAPVDAIEFDEASLILEYNATDDDAEVVLDVDADMGLSRFVLFAPTGEKILEVNSNDVGGLGMRKYHLETPEPSLAEVLAAYPEGVYRFVGFSVERQRLSSFVKFSHALPPTPIITYPVAGATNVPVSGAAAAWSVPGAVTSFFLELENDDLAVDVKSNLLGSATSFGFPEGWLLADTEYQLGIAARAANGNLTVVELDFTTLP